MGDGGIGGQARGKAGGGARCFAANQRQDALVGEAQPAFCGDDPGAIQRQAQMRGLLDRSPDRTER